MKTRMKHIFVLGLLILSSGILHAQDLIVTQEGDSLNCKITKIKSDNIYFTFKYNEDIRSTLLPVDQVVNYQYDYYQTAEIPADKIVNNEIYPHFRAAITGGWSNRIAKISKEVLDDFKSYMNDLKSGSHYNLDFSYYFTELVGVGLKYSTYLSKNEIDNVYQTLPDGSTQYGKMSDDIRIDFIGPFFSMRYLNASKKNCFLMNFGLGYMGYKDKGIVVSQNGAIKGYTAGFCFDIGYDMGISKNFALGIQLSLFGGTLSQYDQSIGNHTETVKLEKDNYENLSRIDLSIGLRFNK
jgi:hypothetical protein